MIAPHPVFGFQVADHRFYRCPPLHLALESRCGPAYLARDPDLEAVWVIVPAITLVDMRALDFNPGYRRHIGHRSRQRVAVIRVAVQRPGMQHELATLGLCDRSGDAHLAAELIRCAGFALADALHFRRMQGIDLWPALALGLLPNPDRQGQPGPEAFLQGRIPFDLAAHIPDHSAEPGAQKPQLAVSPLELMCMKVAADPDQGVFG